MLQVIQNRFDGSQDFFKSWSDYKHGFGNLAGEFWLGLEKIYYLTNQKLYELRVEMEGQDGQDASGIYSVFTLGPEYEGYRISTIGTFRGSAGVFHTINFTYLMRFLNLIFILLYFFLHRRFFVLPCWSKVLYV